MGGSALVILTSGVTDRAEGGAGLWRQWASTLSTRSCLTSFVMSTVLVVVHENKKVVVFWALEGLGVEFPANVPNYRSLGGVLGQEFVSFPPYVRTRGQVA